MTLSIVPRELFLCTSLKSHFILIFFYNRPQESSTFRSTPLYVFYQSTDARGANLPNHPFFTNHSQKKRIIDGHITHFMNHLEIHHHDLNTIHLETNPITES